LIDALLGAAALGDVGTHVPDTSPEFEGANSIELLAEAVSVIESAGFRVVNVDITIIAESPRVRPWVQQMAETIGGHLHVPRSFVSIKGKTNESMGWIGRGEGMAVIAVTLLERVDDDETLRSPGRGDSGG
jgi:2-C-methyl-D-erythritol 2,4-cyclodiphosphate synthase